MNRLDVLVETRLRRTRVASGQQRHHEPAAHPALDVGVVAQVALELQVEDVGEVQRVDRADHRAVHKPGRADDHQETLEVGFVDELLHPLAERPERGLLDLLLIAAGLEVTS
ncbi:hypothetical protein D3C78_1245770 [compost metagenome]